MSELNIKEPYKKEPQNDAAQDKYDLYKSQERLRALLNKNMS